MKILKLDLRAFGPFTDVALDLSGGHQGLHVIYGANEAGKSSSLRALEQLLFGIPSRSADDFVHPYQNLRVGATLGRPGVPPLEFLRRKGTKNTLLQADNSTPLEESALRPFLDGLDQDLFTTMFGSGHAQLVEGGQEVVRGRGDVGQLLFAAGAGIADLRSARDRMEAEAGVLFKTRGQTQRINQRLRELDEAKARIRQSQLHSDDWISSQREFQEANARLGDVETQLQQARRERRRLERIGQALPIIAKRKECRQQQDDLGPVAILPADFAEQRREAVSALTLQSRAEEAARQEIEQIDQQLQSLVIPESLMAQSPQVELLPELLGSHRKALRDQPALVAKREQLERDAAAILRQLRPDLKLDAAEQIRLTRAQQVAIHTLGNQYAARAQELERAGAEIQESQSALADVRDELASLEAPRDPAPLKAILRRTQSQGDLEQELARAAAALRQSEEQAAVDLANLPLWSGGLQELERLPLPAAETVDRYERDLARSEQQVCLLEERCEKTAADQADVDRQIEQLQLEGAVPTEEDLFAARAWRDMGWDLVLATWKSSGPDADLLAEFLQGQDAESDLATAYHAAVKAADDLADRLRREANRVATRAGLQSHRDALARQLETIGAQWELAREAHRRLERSWCECWQPLEIVSRGPQEMRAWLARHKALVEQARAIRVQRTGLQPTEERIRASRRQLEQCLRELGEQPAGEGESLALLMERCAATADRIESAAGKRVQLEKNARQLQSRLATASAAAEKAEAGQSQWREQWAAALRPLGLAAETNPTVANEFVARITELFERLKEAEGFAERIEGIDRDAKAFRQQVQDLARQIDPELAAGPPEAAAEELIGRLRKAKSDQRIQDDLQRQRKRQASNRDKSRSEIEQTTAVLKTICQEAGCDSPEDLPKAEEASDRAGRLRDTLGSLDDQLLHLSSGAAIESLLSEAAAVEADDLPARFQQLDEQIQQLETEKKSLSEKIGSTRSKLEQMDDSAVAADAAEEVQDLLAQIESDAEEYARLRLALAVLREGIERYRKKHAGPVLQRASELFQQLTLGSFEGLRADFDDQGENVLVGVRPGGTDTVGLSGMSDGTGDQLYLALRLASLENYLATREPIPFIVDDILISFDDARSAAALSVLADFSRHTQIIFFTHHQHLVELARANLRDVLFVHELRQTMRNV